MKPWDWPEGTLFLQCLTQGDVPPDSAVEQEAFDADGQKSRVPVTSRGIGETIPAGTRIVIANLPGVTNWHVVAAEC